MSHKYQVTLPGPVSEQLEQLAAGAEQPPTTLAGQFIQSEVARAVADGRVGPLRRLPPTAGAVAPGERARWLEPYGGDADWRADMWGQIVALHGRFPKALAGLQEGWWNENELLDTLCALAVWRAELDDATRAGACSPSGRRGCDEGVEARGRCRRSGETSEQHATKRRHPG